MAADWKKDSLPGISLDQAYEYLKGRKSKTVIVAILDDCIDTSHIALEGIFFRIILSLAALMLLFSTDWSVNCSREIETGLEECNNSVAAFVEWYLIADFTPNACIATKFCFLLCRCINPGLGRGRIKIWQFLWFSRLIQIFSWTRLRAGFSWCIMLILILYLHTGNCPVLPVLYKRRG